MSRKKTSFDINFFKRLTLFVDELGMTQTEFADSVGISQGYLWYVLKGKKGPSVELIAGLYNVYRDKFHWLVTGEEAVSRKDEKDTYIYKDEYPEIADLLEGARKVLKSGNKVAYEVLERNIRYFSHAVSVEQKLKNIKEDFQSQISELKLEIKNIKVQRQNNRIREEDRPDDGAKIIKQRVM